MIKVKKITKLIFVAMFVLSIPVAFAQTSTEFLGLNSGYSTTYGSYNSFFWQNSGASNTTGHHNTIIGAQSGYHNTTGYYNSFFGYFSGNINSTGYDNAYFGYYAGYTINGNYNTFFGSGTGYLNHSGSGNTMLGYRSGWNSSGSSNVFIDYMVGYSETGSNKLYIDNSNTSAPSIYGDFASNQLLFNGIVGIGTTSSFNTLYKLSVNGKIRAKEIVVESGWSDFVFDENYKLRSLQEVEEFINENDHLPEIPSASERSENGASLGEMQT